MLLVVIATGYLITLNLEIKRLNILNVKEEVLNRENYPYIIYVYIGLIKLTANLMKL